VGGGVDHRQALTEQHTGTGCRSCNTSVQNVRDPEYIGRVYGMLSRVGLGMTTADITVAAVQTSTIVMVTYAALITLNTCYATINISPSVTPSSVIFEK